MLGYIKNVLIGVDQLVNAVIGGWPDESLSSRSWREYVSGKRLWPKRLIDTLLWFDKNHCEESYLSEKERRQLPPDLRE
ncbi:hypothetical protein [Duodenibacillus massiliensis]|uniref:hypothetical protein n=1 Tax=Duodenibacillus massiliensis TaxID=1852381 RepID=UPI00307B2C91